MDHIVVVYDDATVSAPELRIKQGDTIEWKGPANATMKFQDKGCPLQNGPRFTIANTGTTGRNGVNPNQAEASYKYDSQVGSKKVDPRIEIIP